jgi:cytochrome c oxidase cbb3-type subunit I/II
MSPGSLMPAYPWLIDDKLNSSSTERKIRIMQSLGVPYPSDYDKMALQDLHRQAEEITARLKESGIDIDPEKEIIALIAYLQRLGTDIKGGD